MEGDLPRQCSKRICQPKTAKRRRRTRHRVGADTRTGDPGEPNLKKTIELLEQERRKALMTQVQEAMPQIKTTQLCRLFQVPRSSFYYRSTRQAEVHEAVTKTVEEMAQVWLLRAHWTDEI